VQKTPESVDPASAAVAALAHTWSKHSRGDAQSSVDKQDGPRVAAPLVASATRRDED
jgi:hypothetical protein